MIKRNNQRKKQIVNILLCGNTKLLEADVIRQVAGVYNVVITGDVTFQRFSTRRTHFYEENPGSERFGLLCSSFSPDAIWYLSGYVDDGSGLVDEVRMIENLMESASKCNTQKVIFVTSAESMEVLSLDKETMHLSDVSTKAFCCAQVEEFAKYLANKNNLSLILLRVPYIAKKLNEGNYLGGIFSALEREEEIRLPHRGGQHIDFLSLSDLFGLLVAITEEQNDAEEEYTVTSGFWDTVADLQEKIKSVVPLARIGHEDRETFLNAERLESAGRILRKKYGFVPTDHVLDCFEELYQNYQNKEQKGSRLWNRIRTALEDRHSLLLKLVELVLFFFVGQLLLQLTSASVYFRYVDIRLFYIVILAISHGMGIGILAGLLEWISLFISYNKMGVTGTMLFYNIDYWLPFVLYLLSGSVIGYIKNIYQQKNYFLEEENRVLQDKYKFLNNVYQQVIDNKSEYKRQILGYQDSFGKIFEAVENLDKNVAADIFMHGVEIMERILSNHSVAIYTMNEYQTYMRLVACSREMNDKLSKSVKVEDYQQVYDTIINNGVWKNVEFIEGLPMYAFSVNKNSKSQVVIALYQADNSQLGLYYSNQFNILCNLIRMSFERAYEYQLAIESEKYVEDTEILKTEYFKEILDIHNRMEEAGVASYALLKILSEDYRDVGERIVPLIRQSDVLGFMEDGFVHLMLTQVTNENLNAIGTRLDNQGLAYEIERD